MAVPAGKHLPKCVKKCNICDYRCLPAPPERTVATVRGPVCRQRHRSRANENEGGTLKLAHLLTELAPLAVVGDVSVDVRGLVSDSRQVAPGALFAAYKGVSVDGNDFIADAVNRGAAAIVGERHPAEVAPLLQTGGDSLPYIQVANGRQALAWLSAAWYGFPARRMRMVGITGTDGKTTTTSLLYHILRAAGEKVAMISTVSAVIANREADTGLHTTTPDSIDVQRLLAEMVAAGVDTCVLEVTSHGLAQHRVTGCEFDVVAVTNITHEHLDIHGSLEAYRAAKASLFSGLATSYRKPGVSKVSVLNRDDSSYAYLQKYASDLQLSYGFDPLADVSARDVVAIGELTHVDVVSPRGDFDLQTRLFGRFNVANILAATAAALGLGVDTQAIRTGVNAFPGVPGRLESVDRSQPFTVLVDFAHTPKSLESVLQTVRQLAPDRRVILAFGCAGLRDVEKRPLMGEIASRLADHAILTAEDPRTEALEDILEAMAAGCRQAGGVEGQSFERIADRGAALARAIELASPGDVVIACGKGHEQSMCFGAVEYPWNDREALIAILEGRSPGRLPTSE